MGYIEEELEKKKAVKGEGYFISSFHYPFIYCFVRPGENSSLCGRIKTGMGGSHWREMPGGEFCPECEDILRHQE
ncbi:MAG TPA: hypothetical protein VGM92_01200 [Candidatus Kapabacteria bacterium]|jgi:hypothetical protein